MKNVLIPAEELSVSLLYKPNWLQARIDHFRYNLITKSVFKDIKEAFLSGENEALVHMPNNYKQKILYEDVIARLRFLGYEVEDGTFYYHVRWPKEKEVKKDEVMENIKSGKGLIQNELDFILKSCHN